eukprot:EG_transcript_7280
MSASPAATQTEEGLTISRSAGLTAEEQASLQAQFRALDHNGDGVLSEKEFTDPISYLLGERVALLLFRAFDVNGDGHIAPEEFVECMRLIAVGTPQEKLEFSFSLFDSERKGYVTLQDFAALMALARDEHQLSAAEVSRLFLEADINQDGYMSFTEFERLMTTHPALQGHYTRLLPRPQERARPLVFGEKGWRVIMPLLRAIQEFVLEGPVALPQRHVELSHGLLCTEYEPAIFAELREHWAYPSLTYLRHLGVNQLLQNLLFGALVTPHELASSGSSGSFFFISPDTHLIIKSIKDVEAALLLAILPQYLRHHRARPHSLLARICGLYNCLTPRSTHKSGVYFVVMMNIHPIPSADVVAVYDVKGSHAGRSTPLEKRKGPLTALKDLDVPRPLPLADPAEFQLLVEDVEYDAGLLRSLNIMDYSLLVCCARHPPAPHAANPSGSMLRCLKSPGPELYYVGIIDILTPFNAKRWGEYVYKRVVQSNASCVPPDQYADRFIQSIRTLFSCPQRPVPPSYVRPRPQRPSAVIYGRQPAPLPVVRPLPPRPPPPAARPPRPPVPVPRP